MITEAMENIKTEMEIKVALFYVSVMCHFTIMADNNMPNLFIYLL